MVSSARRWETDKHVDGGSSEIVENQGSEAKCLSGPKNCHQKSLLRSQRYQRVLRENDIRRFPVLDVGGPRAAHLVAPILTNKPLRLGE